MTNDEDRVISRGETGHECESRIVVARDRATLRGTKTGERERERGEWENPREEFFLLLPLVVTASFSLPLSPLPLGIRRGNPFVISVGVLVLSATTGKLTDAGGHEFAMTR